KAVDGVDLQLRRHEILGLIGPNGAGKTTLVNTLTGFQRPTDGSVHLDGVDVTGWPPDRLARAGLARTFQAVRLFSGLTVFESDALVRALAGIRDDFACGVMVIEHDMRVIMRLCERIQVLDYGKTISIGTPSEVQRDPGVLRAYLGSERQLEELVEEGAN